MVYLSYILDENSPLPAPPIENRIESKKVSVI